MPLDTDIVREVVLEAGLATPEQIEEAASGAESKKTSLLDELVSLRVVSRDELFSSVAEKLDVPYIDVINYAVDPETLKLFPMGFAVENLICPLFLVGNTLTAAMSDPTDYAVIDRLRIKTGYEIEPCLSSEAGLRQAIEQNYAGIAVRRQGGVRIEDGGQGTGSLAEAPVSRIVELILNQAVRDKSSDIHIEPEENRLRIRFRIDGILQEVPAPSKELEAAIISRIKIMANMDIAITRIPQDGHFRVNVDGKKVDARVSTVPTIYGENVVIRLLAAFSELMSFEEQGFSAEEISMFEEMISHPWGMVLATGPTGSGKTTTLYSALTSVNSVEKNIITIEDPVEIRLPLVRQIEVSSQVGLSFANGLRSIVRQDPDIIMVGEIRDSETAAIAVQAALTGHMVFSTLHTNDAAGAITRLVDMGVEPFLLSGSLTGVIAQRLVRRICPECREEYSPDRELLLGLGLEDNGEHVFYRSTGCPMCHGTGYKGRVGIFEFLRVSDAIREAITNRESSSRMKRRACEEGMTELKNDGLSKALRGITTIEEVARVTEIGVKVQPPGASREVSGTGEARPGPQEGRMEYSPREKPG